MEFEAVRPCAGEGCRAASLDGVGDPLVAVSPSDEVAGDEADRDREEEEDIEDR